MQALSPTPPGREPISFGLAGTLQAFKGYICWLSITQNPAKITREGYNKFQTGPKPRDVPGDPSGSREAPDKFKRPYQLPQRPHQLVDPALKKILVGVLVDDGSIEECLAYDFLMSIPDVLSLPLAFIDALSLSAAKKHLLKVFKGYVWWYHIQTGRLPSFPSLTKEMFDSFRSSPHWDPEALFGVFIPEPEESEQWEIHSPDLERSFKQEHPTPLQRDITN